MEAYRLQIYGNCSIYSLLYIAEVASPVTLMGLKVFATLISVAVILSFPLLKSDWMRAAIPIFVMLILPEQSGMYCVVYLFPVIILFLNQTSYAPIDLVYLLCFIILLNPFQDAAGILSFLSQYPFVLLSVMFSLLAIESILLIILRPSELIAAYRCLFAMCKDTLLKPKGAK